MKRSKRAIFSLAQKKLWSGRNLIQGPRSKRDATRPSLKQSIKRKLAHTFEGLTSHYYVKGHSTAGQDSVQGYSTVAMYIIYTYSIVRQIQCNGII